MKSEFTGNIVDIRALEDTIRASRKYTEGVQTFRTRHPEGPIQGEEFPSRVFCKDYEVYPDVVVSWDMPAGQALDWLWRDVACINVTLKYDYRANKAEMTVKGGLGTVREMEGKIPGFREALAAVVAHHLSPPVSVLATEMSTAKAGTKSQA